MSILHSINFPRRTRVNAPLGQITPDQGAVALGRWTVPSRSGDRDVDNLSRPQPAVAMREGQRTIA
jgi:hypothetical protein